MLIYKRYILTSIILPFIVMTSVLTSLIWVTQTMKLIYLIDKGIAFKDFLFLIIFNVPTLLFIILPVTTTASIIFIYNKFKEERQIVILQNSGLSNLSIMTPGLILALVITVFAYYISTDLMPLSHHLLKQKISYFRENYFSKIIDVRTFNQVSKNITIYVSNKTNKGVLEGIILFDNNNPQNKSVIFAKYGQIITNADSTILRLTNGSRQAYDDRNNLTKLYFKDLVVELNQDEIDPSSARLKNYLELRISELLWPSLQIPENKRNSFIAEGHQRLIWPSYNLIFVFLALSIFLRLPYIRGYNSVKHLIITFIPIVGLAYLHFTIQNLANKNINFIILSYVSIICVLLFAIWQSVSR